jgi:hypothetical protein
VLKRSQGTAAPNEQYGKPKVKDQSGPVIAHECRPVQSYFSTVSRSSSALIFASASAFFFRSFSST